MAPETPQVPLFSFIASGQTDQDTPVEGWPLLARLMTARPYFEAFSRFEELNVKNLLYYQVELAAIQYALEQAEIEDLTTPAEYETDIRESQLHKSPEGMIDTDSRQWAKVVKLRTCLREYSKSSFPR